MFLRTIIQLCALESFEYRWNYYIKNSVFHSFDASCEGAFLLVSLSALLWDVLFLSMHDWISSVFVCVSYVAMSAYLRNNNYLQNNKHPALFTQDSATLKMNKQSSPFVLST